MAQFSSSTRPLLLQSLLLLPLVGAVVLDVRPRWGQRSSSPPLRQAARPGSGGLAAATTANAARTRAHALASTLGNRKEVWLADSLPASSKAFLLQRGSSSHRRNASEATQAAFPAAAAQPFAWALPLQASLKVEDTEREVQALTAFSDKCQKLVAAVEAAARRLNGTASGNPTQSALHIPVMLSAVAEAMMVYKQSISELQHTLLISAGLPIYIVRYGWMEPWRHQLQDIIAVFQATAKAIADIAQGPAGAVASSCCDSMRTFGSALENRTILYILNLGVVVNLARANATAANQEPTRSMLQMILGAMSALKVDGMFLEKSGLKEEVERSLFTFGKDRLGCRWQDRAIRRETTPAPLTPEQQAKKDQEDKAKKQMEDTIMKKLAHSARFHPSNYIYLFIIAVAVCGAATCVSFMKCLQIPLYCLLAPFIELGKCAGKVLLCPCNVCCRRKKTSEWLAEAAAAKAANPLPVEVPQQAILESEAQTKQADALAQALGSSEQPPWEVLPAGQPTAGQEHPMYKKLGLDPMSQLRIGKAKSGQR